MIKRNAFFLLLTLAGSAQAISFGDFYQRFGKAVDAQVAEGVLDLSNVGLTDLIGFDKVPDITSIWKLYLTGNKLTALPANFFSGLTALEFLDLGENRLAMLPDNVFDGLPLLYYLSLENNQIVALQDNIFRGLTALRELLLNGNRLTILPENIFHGLIALKTLNLGNNQFTAISANIFQGLAALENLFLFNNPISLTQEQLAEELQLPDTVELEFKRPAEEQAEQKLFTAIGNADVSAVRRRLADIMAGWLPPELRPLIVISKIRDANGNNLLHAAIKDAAERIKVIDGMSIGVPEDEKKAVKEVQAEQKDEINDRYMKIISAILSCGEECVQDMLFTPNAEKQQVVDSLVAKLGFSSPITQTILYVLNPEEEKRATEEKEKHEAQK